MYDLARTRSQVLLISIVCACLGSCSVVRDRGVVHADVYYTFKKGTVQVTYPAPKPKTRLTLPQKCEKFLSEDSERWIDCMGVGYVK